MNTVLVVGVIAVVAVYTIVGLIAWGNWQRRSHEAWLDQVEARALKAKR